MSLAMSQISRRRADQLRDLVGMLKLRAIDLDAGMRVAEQRLGHRFHHPRFARAGRAQKKQVAHRTSRRIQSRQKHLVDLGHLFNSLVLPYDAAAQCGFKFPSIVAAAVRVQHGSQIRSHILTSSPGRISRPFQPGSTSIASATPTLLDDKICQSEQPLALLHFVRATPRTKQAAGHGMWIARPAQKPHIWLGLAERPQY